MATHSRILAWRIPCTEEPGGLQSMGLQKSWTQLTDNTQHTCRINNTIRLSVSKRKGSAVHRSDAS